MENRGNTIKEITFDVSKDLKKFLGEILFPFGGDAICCNSCKKTVAIIMKMDMRNYEQHIVLEPCARVVLGIHPQIHDFARKNGIKSFVVAQRYIFLCSSCGGMDLMEKIDKFIPLKNKKYIISQEGRLVRNPVVDMPEFNESKGCWITITEFTLDYPRVGRFFNYQTDIKEFNRIIEKTELIKTEPMPL